MCAMLNDLILETDPNHKPGRNEKKLCITTKKKGIDAVSIAPDPGGVLDRMNRVKGALTGARRWVLVRTGQHVETSDIVVETTDISTGIKYKITLKLDIETPTNDTALRQMCDAFRDARLAPYKRPGDIDPALGPQRMFQDEMRQWLMSQYRQGSRVAEHKQPDWLNKQATDINHHILTEYGLDANSRLVVRFASSIQIAPEVLVVPTEAKDSSIKLRMPVRVGCEVMGSDPFTEKPLSKEEFEAEMRAVIDRYIRSEVTLQQYRFETGWFEGLEKAITARLEEFGRVPIGINNELPRGSGKYSKDGHSIVARDARFVPAGWDAREDEIRFSTHADISVVDAATFEKGLTETDISKIDETLRDWLKDAMQTAVDTCLHEIHRADQGYAELLAGWNDTYRKRIEDKLRDMAGERGLKATTIVATPDRPEMQLDRGVVLDLGDLMLDTKQSGGMVGLSGTVEVSVKKFSDIKEILDRTTAPLDHIRDDIVIKSLRETAKSIDYNYYSLYFYAGEEGESGKETGMSVIEQFRENLAKALADNGVILGQLKLDPQETEQQKVLKRLIAAPSQQVRYTLGRKTIVINDEQVPTEEFKIWFNLQITGASLDNIARFIDFDWTRETQGNESEFDAIVQRASMEMASSVTAQETMPVLFADQKGEKGQQAFQKLIEDKLSLFLKEEYGLSGKATSIDRERVDDTLGLEKEQEVKTERAEILARGEADRRKTQEALEADADIHAAKLEDLKDRASDGLADEAMLAHYTKPKRRRTKLSHAEMAAALTQDEPAEAGETNAKAEDGEASGKRHENPDD